VEAERERRDLEARMHQAQKLEGLGVMAGGIAHDFNNLLTPILGDTSLALLDLPADSPLRTRLQRVQAAAHRAATLTNQMLSYAGEESLHVEALNLSTLVEEIGQLLETAASREAVLVYQLQRDLPLIEGDPARLSQVVMNLITNAAEALGDDEGRIIIRTGKVDLAPDDCKIRVIGSELPPGAYVFFEVIDTGCGMDDDTLARIFDPFFTTKFTGRGLGLAAVLGIVRAHRGAIELKSQPQKGTTFRIFLPSTNRRFTRQPTLATDVENWHGEGTILIVDDEEGVRDMCADTLSRAGFTVICGTDGREGIELFERHVDEIRAVLLDRTMPNTSGDEVFDEIRRIRPHSRIILTSGYSEKRAAQQFVGKGLNSFLQKPFLPPVLLQTLKQVLEAPSDE
jgi:nitrogen-specific signal transduction histidine kinase/CheY-like chemotaxis protein